MEIRKLTKSDDHIQFLSLLSKLNNYSYNLDPKKFIENLDVINSQNSFVLIGLINNEIVCTGKLFIETKFSNPVGHIEDVVVKYKRQGLGRKIMKELINISKNNNCYKLVLNCSNENEIFYKKLGFSVEGYQMVMRFTKEYEYIHNVCFCVNQMNKFLMIKKHFDIFNSLDIPDNKKLFHITIMSNDYLNHGFNPKGLNDQKDDIVIKIKKMLNSEDFDYTMAFNSGGTVRSLWLIWNKILEQNWNVKYISTWEDDIVPKHDNWYKVLKNYIDSTDKDYYYIGMLTKHKNDTTNKKYWEKGYKFLTDAEIKNIRKKKHWTEEFFKLEDWKWTDGGLYFTTFHKLCTIESKIGRFNKSPENEVYVRQKHGIEDGEVGFPSRLNQFGLAFFGLPCDKNWNDSFVSYL